ncbi:MAG: TsoY family (seleno)protein [Gemmobacter sp.]
MTLPLARPADTWSPLYYLAAVGAGGLAVTFFMWLMFWVPHPGQPVPVFEDIAAAFAAGGPATRAMIAVAAVGIAVLAALNLHLTVWNLRRHAEWKRTEAAAAFLRTNAESQLMAQPLALAMSVNALFIVGLVFVPGLWGIVEYLFPAALLAFAAIGVLALGIMGRFLGRVIGEGGFRCAANNSFGQILPAFAFAMIGVGASAPAALSLSATTAGLSLLLSTFFVTAAVLIAAIAMVLGMRALLENGASIETAPTLLILVPFLTVVGIAMLRQSHGLHVHFDSHDGAGETLTFLSRILSAQVLFTLFGLAVLARLGYAARFIFGRENSVGAYALVCPGVALSVMLHFWLNKGLVDAGLVAKFGAAYWSVSAVAVALQIAMIWLVWHLNRRHFGQPRPALTPAE